MTSEDIIQIICEILNITPDDLRKRSKKEPLPTARALIAHYLYRELRMYPREILPLLGFPKYSRVSVYHYLPGKRTLIESRLPFNKYIQDYVNEINKRLDGLK